MVLRKKQLDEVRAFVGTDVIKVFTGVRRCGKSMLLGQVWDMIVSEIDPGAPTFYLDLEKGHVFFSQKIVAFLKHEHVETASSTVLNYLKACEEAFLLPRVEREDLIGKRILSVDEKYYVADCGLRNANVSSNLGRDIDQRLEVVVYREMRRRGYVVTIGRVKEKEVDFVCRNGSNRLYIQVAYLMPTEETREREFGRACPYPINTINLSFRWTDSISRRMAFATVIFPNFLLMIRNWDSGENFRGRFA